MSELISGKDALIALANGEGLQYRFPDSIWLDFTNNLNSNGSGLKVVDLLNDYAAFRLKPQTIKINGIEVPKPDYIVDTPHDYDGCWEINIGGTYYLFKTEQNYKQVIEALRSVFNG